ncbi:MAG: aryl-sulfate sulfotransferase [Bacilli bacterium]|nr:aryl-sulfate sulfotransferase [Bacilli bacterium]
MKKKLTLLIYIIIVTSLMVYVNFDKIIKAVTVENTYWYEWNTKIELDESLGDNIYSVEKNEDISIFTNGYQNAISKKIESLVSDSKQAVLIYNPYGTNTSSFYYSFKSEEEYDITYCIHVENETISDYVQTAKTNKTSNNTYAYQLIGFVYGEENELQISYSKEGKTIKEETYKITMPAATNEENTQLTLNSGTSSEALSNGLFAVFGLDKSFNSNIYLYDNEGILRSEYVLKNYRSDRILFIGDSMLYSYKKNGFIKVNSLGKITDIYDFSGYTQHHDFIYDESSNCLLILANENDTDTIEDIIISLNLDTKEINKIIDMKTLLPELYDLAVPLESGNTYGGDELDWIHLNSLTLEDGNLIVSSRELSTIIKIKDIYDEPSIAYMIADESLYTDSSYQQLLLEKEGDFISQAGQHSITYAYDDTLKDGQYYLIMYNNNYANARTRQDLDWSAFIGAGIYQEGTESKYYKYLVDENEGTYTLVENISLPYSSIVSNVQDYENHIISSSGMSHCFNEYDSNGELIAQYDYNAEKYAYRIFKYNFNTIYFEAE